MICKLPMFRIKEMNPKYFNEDSRAFIEDYNKKAECTKGVCEELKLFHDSVEFCMTIAHETENFLKKTNFDETHPRSMKTSVEVQNLITETIAYAHDCYHKAITAIIEK